MEGIIDILIPILFVALPAIFKAIADRLEKSGKGDKAGKFKRIAEAMSDDDKRVLDEIETPVLDEILEKRRLQVYGPDEDPVEPMSINPVPVMIPKPAVTEIDVMDYIDKPETEVKRQIKHVPPKPKARKPVMLLEEEPKNKGEKIDPKKLVIYSEIMKPKF